MPGRKFSGEGCPLDDPLTDGRLVFRRLLTSVQSSSEMTHTVSR